MTTIRFIPALFSVVISIFGLNVQAQDFPNKPVHIVTGAAGGGNDFIARQIAQGITAPLGQPVVVDNKGAVPLSAEYVSKMPPDGYTLMVAGDGLLIIPLLQKAVWDAGRDFSPVTLISREVSVVAVNPSVAAASIKELIALAKAKPGELNYASGGPGSSTHLATELFKSMAGINIVHVPYKGNPPAVAALLGGEVQVMINDLGLVAPHMSTGKLRALAVTSATPSARVPNLPTVAAAGLPGYEAGGFTGMYVPAKTPASVINRLNQEIVRVLNQPDVKERFLNAGEEVAPNTPEQFAGNIKTDTAKWTKVIKDANIRIDN